MYLMSHVPLMFHLILAIAQVWFNKNEMRVIL
jgi:hypothetical protein